MGEASRLANVLEPSFTPLENWAHRALAAETVPTSVDAFDARLFSPIEDRDDVVEAWLARTGTAPVSFSAHGTSSPIDDDRMAHVRLPDRREVRVGTMTMDDPRTTESDPLEVVVLEHTSHPSPTETISFAVAFVRPR